MRRDRPQLVEHVTRSLLAMTVRSVGIVVTLLAANFAVGWGWGVVRSSPSSRARSPAPHADVINIVPYDAAATTVTVPAHPATPLDPATQLPMSQFPWAREYFEDLAAQPTQFWPYSGDANASFRSRYINQHGTVRVSYEQPGSASAPLVSFYGGSTMWGEGQRDDGTIPSDVARDAERDGLALRVVNHGVRGTSSWEEALEFEDDVARGEHPALAVFYDGWNDCTIQSETNASAQPWEFLEQDVRDRIGGVGTATQPTSRAAIEAAVSLYRSQDALDLAIARIRRLAEGHPAGAAALLPGSLDAQASGSRVEKACAAVYERSRRIEVDTARQAGITALFFWQPVNPVDDPSYRPAVVAKMVGLPTIDISGVMDGRAPSTIYLDGGHTDELGASIVAGAIYPHVRAALRVVAGGH